MTAVRDRLAAAGAAGLLTTGAALGLVGAAQAGPPHAHPPAAVRAVDADAPVLDDRVLIDAGHVDAVAPRMVGDAFRLLFKDSRDPAAPIWRHPESVILHVTDAGRVEITEDMPGLAFLGPPGTVFHHIPETQDPAIVWAGWNTEAFANTDITANFAMSLEAVDGPGQLVMFASSPFGEPLFTFDSRDGLPDTIGVPARTHAHSMWVFTRPGVYRLTFGYGATATGGGELRDTAVYTVVVGDATDPDTVPLPGSDPTTSPSPTATATTGTPTATPPPTSPPTTPGTASTPPTKTATSATSPPPPTNSLSSSPTSSTSAPESPAGGTTSPPVTDGATTPPAGGGTTDGGGKSSGSSGGSLASTGVGGVLPWAIGSVLLVAAGGTVLLVRLRRRTPHADAPEAHPPTP